MTWEARPVSSTGASRVETFLILALLVVGVSQNASSSSTIPLNGRRVGGWRTKKKPETLEGLKYLSFV